MVLDWDLGYIIDPRRILGKSASRRIHHISADYFFRDGSKWGGDFFSKRIKRQTRDFSEKKKRTNTFFLKKKRFIALRTGTIDMAKTFSTKKGVMAFFRKKYKGKEFFRL